MSSTYHNCIIKYYLFSLELLMSPELPSHWLMGKYCVITHKFNVIMNSGIEVVACCSLTENEAVITFGALLAIFVTK